MTTENKDGGHGIDYDLTTRILAGILSPWVFIGIFACVITFMYFFYYRPRLHYSYGSYPTSPRIFIVPPQRRRAMFRKDPVEYLHCAHSTLQKNAVFWTDVVSGYESKPVSIVTDSALISQFLMTDDRDSLSWDAPLRAAWNDLFEPSSSFGKRPTFYTASRYCLANGFSLSRTSTTSNYAQITLDQTDAALANLADGDLYDLVDEIVFATLMQIFFGGSLTSKLQETMRRIATLINQEQLTAKQAKVLAAAYREEMNTIVQKRVGDIEQFAGCGDYLQWLLGNRGGQDNTDAESFASANDGERPSSGASRDGSNDDTQQRRENYLRTDLPDHLLSIFQQTHLLITTCIVWGVYSSATLDNNVFPDPLFLVRKTRKEILLGNNIIPKDCYVAISPVLARPKSLSYHNIYSESKQTASSTELSTFSAMNSVSDLNDFSNYDTPIMSGLHPSPSNGSFSPLLRTRFSSATSMNDLSDTSTRVNNEQLNKSKKGSWIRRYPQGHLMSLVIGSVTNTLSMNLTVTGSASIKPRYGTAKTLWLPFPTSSISVLKSPNSGIQRPPTSLFTRSRSGSTSLFGKSNVEVIDEVQE